MKTQVPIAVKSGDGYINSLVGVKKETSAGLK